MYLPEHGELNKLYLTGIWNFSAEYATAMSENAAIFYPYAAKGVYLVAQAENETIVIVKRDGENLPAHDAGEDVEFENGLAFVKVKEARLYRIVKQDSPS